MILWGSIIFLNFYVNTSYKNNLHLVHRAVKLTCKSKRIRYKNVKMWPMWSLRWWYCNINDRSKFKNGVGFLRSKIHFDCAHEQIGQRSKLEQLENYQEKKCIFNAAEWMTKNDGSVTVKIHVYQVIRLLSQFWKIIQKHRFDKLSSTFFF